MHSRRCRTPGLGFAAYAEPRVLVHYEPPKTVCETPFASIFPPSMENGDGTRFQEGCRANNIDITSGDAAKLFRLFDGDRSGEITVAEFTGSRLLRADPEAEAQAEAKSQAAKKAEVRRARIGADGVWRPCGGRSKARSTAGADRAEGQGRSSFGRHRQSSQETQVTLRQDMKRERMYTP